MVSKDIKDLWELVVFFGVILLILIIIIGGFYRVTLMTYVNDKVCNEIYGEDWEYEYTHDWGKYCIEKDYVNMEIINRVAWRFSREELEGICEIPRFFELSKWNHKCFN